MVYYFLEMGNNMARILLFSLILLLAGCSGVTSRGDSIHPHRPRVLGYIEHLGHRARLYSQESFEKWLTTEGISDYLSKHEWNASDGIWVYKRLLELNKLVEYKSDTKGDYYKTPLETLKDKGGDCEDLSILTAVYLRWCGYPHEITIFYGKRYSTSENHHLWVYLPKEKFLIDNHSTKNKTMQIKHWTIEQMREHGYVDFYTLSIPKKFK